MSEFDLLQGVIRQFAGARQAEQRACEAFLHALYHAFRTAGAGLPLNNVTLDLIPDPASRQRPPPPGSFYAAWVRLGLCEVFVRVRRLDGAFHGEYGQSGVFRVDSVGEGEMLALSRQIMRDVAATYGPELVTAPHLN